jgi:hypothetical protein
VEWVLLLLLVYSLTLSLLLNYTIFVSFPIAMDNRLEKLHRVFYGVELGSSFKFHLVNYSRICTMMKSGGLGVEISFSFIELFWKNGCGTML